MDRQRPNAVREHKARLEEGQAKIEASLEEKKDPTLSEAVAEGALAALGRPIHI